MSAKPSSRAARIRSFAFALAGLGTLLRSQPNARIHGTATLAVVGCGIWLDVTPGEWCWLVLAMMAVWISEALNTALEFLADAVCPELNPQVKHAKDVAAGAVLIAALGAVVIGILVLGPYFAFWI